MTSTGGGGGRGYDRKERRDGPSHHGALRGRGRNKGGLDRTGLDWRNRSGSVERNQE